jgi:RNA polymerase sigma factor (sigma-70 family)
MERIRILIADDHQLFRDGLRALLTSTPDIEVIGEATAGDEVVSMAAALQPDVILMDIQMPGLNGIEATRRILHTSPHIGVLVITMFEDDATIFAAMRAGARGYVLKEASYSDLLRAVHVVGSGEAIFSTGVAVRLMDFFANMRLPAIPQVFPELSEREREILDLIAQGLRNAQIAERLVLSEKTVRNHVSNILSKLQAADRAELIIRAKTAGLG